MDLDKLMNELKEKLDTLSEDLVQTQQDEWKAEGLVQYYLLEPMLDCDRVLQDGLEEAHAQLDDIQGVFIELEKKLIAIAKILLDKDIKNIMI